MNLLLIRPDEIDSSEVVSLTDRRFEHLRKVLKVSVGQELRAAVERQSTGVARVTAVRHDQIDVSYRPLAGVSVPSIDIALAIPRPKALTRMVQAAASFGVRRIDLTNAWRVDAAYFESHKLFADVLSADARIGCEQGRSGYVPDVNVHRFFVPFVEGVLGPRVQGVASSVVLVGHPTEPGYVSKLVEEVLLGADPSANVTLVIGPDGGFVASELDSLAKVGAILVNFGPAVLRSENALVTGMAQLELIRRLQSHRS